MILPLLLLAAQTQTSGQAQAPAQTQAPAPAPIQAGPPDPAEGRFNRCINLATNDPQAGEQEANQWQRDNGGFLAHQCMGIVYTTEQRLTAAATEFEAAAHEAEIAHDKRSAKYWAQAGNAWLASGEAMKARAALNASLSSGTLDGLQRGEAYLDRARAFVASGDLEDARVDLDHAIVDAAGDPLAWLLSATLARRMNDLPRAKKDIAEALHRAGDDASVQLEAGNIAALAGDEAGAKAAWSQAIMLRPDGVAARSARLALKQFDTPGGAPTAPTTPPPGR